MQKQSITYKFFAGVGNSLQFILFFGCMFGALFFISDSLIVTILQISILTLVVGILSIVSGAIVSHDQHTKELTDADTEAIASKESLQVQQELAPLDIYLRRSAIAWFIFAGVTLAVLFVGWGIINVGVAVIDMMFEDRRLPGASLILIVVVIIPFISGLFLLATISNLMEAIVDFHIYRQPAIQKTYVDGNPFQKKSLFVQIFSAMRLALIAGGGMSLLVLARIALEYLDAIDPPLWVFLVVVVLMLLFVWLIYRWLMPHVTASNMNKVIEESEKNIIQQYGADSEEAREMRAEIDHWNALSPQEQKQKMAEVEKEAKEIIGSDSESMMEQMGRIVLRRIFLVVLMAPVAMIVIGGVTFLVLGYGELSASITQWGGIIYLILGVVFVIRSAGNIKMPEILEEMHNAGMAGDFDSVRRYLVEARDKVNLHDYGWVLASNYQIIGEFDEAANIARQNISLIMQVEEEKRNTVLLANALRMYGNALIEKEQYAEARKAIKQALKYEPDEVFNYVSLAETYLYQNDGKKAMTTVEKGMSRASDNPDVQIILEIFRSWALALEKQYDESMELLKETFRNNQDVSILTKAEMQYMAGHTLRILGKLEQAEQAYRSAQKTLPGSLLDIQVKKYIQQI